MHLISAGARRKAMPTRIDSMLSHGMGKVKAVKARLSGLVGVFRTLAEQHGEVTMLLERAKVSDARFAELWPTIRRELLSHERAELRELYPHLRSNENTRALADRHDAEASELEELVKRIDELEVNTTSRRDTFRVLIETVASHAREEETKIFPKAQEALGKDQAGVLEAKFLATKKQIAAML
jgi:hemerythrin superfamily protein